MIDFKKNIKASSKRLIRLLELDAPDVIIANEIALLLRYGLAAFQKDMGYALGSIIGGSLRNFFGICRSCDNQITVDDLGICQECGDKFDKENEYPEFDPSVPTWPDDE